MDEEITSVEDNHEEMSSVEHNMVTAALVESSRSALRNHVHDEDDKKDYLDHTDDSKEGRYGLRKRRRPTGQDLERLEHFQSSKDGGLMRSNAPPTSSHDLELEGRPPESLQNRKHVGTESMRNKPPLNAKPAEMGPSQVSSNPHASAVCSASLRPETRVAAPRPNLSKTNPVSVTSVPNPLLHITDTVPRDTSKSILAASPSLPPPVVQISHTVPCPLPGPAVDEFLGVHSAPTKFIESTRSNAHSTPALRIASDALPVSAPTPNVTFTIGDIDDGEKGRRVTINDQPHLGPRIRGFSIDMDCKSLFSFAPSSFVN
jgi:hypothetical protein